MKLRDIRASYTNQKREDAKKDPWAHYVARPLSFYPAWLCIRLGISANTVTLSGLMIGLAGCMVFMFGQLIWGAVLVNIYGLMDYVDGDIARATKTQSTYGARLDGLSYLVITGVLFISIGIGLGEQSLIAVGFFASYTRILRYAISCQANLPSESGKPNIIYRIGMAIIGIREPLLLVCAIVGYLDIFICFYLAVHICELFVIVNKVVAKPKEK